MVKVWDLDEMIIFDILLWNKKFSFSFPSQELNCSSLDPQNKYDILFFYIYCQAQRTFGYITTCYKAINSKDSLVYVLRRIHGENCVCTIEWLRNTKVALHLSSPAGPTRRTSS